MASANRSLNTHPPVDGHMRLPVSTLPLVGLAALLPVLAYAARIEPVAAVAALNVVLIVLAVRAMLGTADVAWLGGAD